jgi:pimeloyl-ACP methyl ester carboxylesterase
MTSSPSSPASEAFDAAHRAMVATWPVVPEDKWVTTPSGRTHFLVAGPPDAPPVFMVPGIATPGVMWTGQIAALADSHRVYAVDLPGNIGFSEPTSRPKGFDYFSRWFVEVLDALGIERADYVGMSYGGYVGAHLALTVPERLRRLVLLAPAATLQGLSGAFMMRAMTMLFWPTRARHASVLRWMAVTPEQGREQYELVMEGMADILYTGRGKYGITVLPNVRNLSDDELRSITVPTLVMIGADEKIYSGPAALARAKALIPGVKTVEIPAASHDLMFAQPARVSAELKAFLGPA